jgi:hypothetical protein
LTVSRCIASAALFTRKRLRAPVQSGRSLIMPASVLELTDLDGAHDQRFAGVR